MPCSNLGRWLKPRAQLGFIGVHSNQANVCLAIPGKVLEIVDDLNDLARVEISGVRRVVNVALVRPDGLEVGDWVLVHVGFALSRIDELEARATLGYLEQLGQAYTDELKAMGR